MKTLTKYYEDVVMSPEPNGFCMLKPEFNEYGPEFVALLKNKGWKVLDHVSKKFSPNEAEDFYKGLKDKPFFHKLCNYMSSGPCECYKCHKRCKDPIGEMKAFKKQVREQWGIDEMKNAMHSSDSPEAVIRECGIAFSKQCNEDNNLDNVQSTIDEFKPNANNQITKIDADGIKSIVKNTDSCGKLDVIVQQKDYGYELKFNEDDFIKNNKITDNIINIAKFFIESEGATKAEVDSKKFILKIYK